MVNPGTVAQPVTPPTPAGPSAVQTPPLGTDSKSPVGKPRAFGSKTFYILITALVVIGAAVFFYVGKLGTQGPVSLPISQAPKSTALDLLIESPSDETLAEDSQIVVKGKTQPNTVVAFFTEVDQNSVESDSQGKFEGTIGLAEGINTLNITAFGEDGVEKNTALNIVYDTESAEAGKNNP
ncbi:MAG: hypothetical protein Q8P89_03915 [bacterium]|nr:hypothetical protein [bacterium]